MIRAIIRTRSGDDEASGGARGGATLSMLATVMIRVPGIYSSDLQHTATTTDAAVCCFPRIIIRPTQCSLPIYTRYVWAT